MNNDNNTNGFREGRLSNGTGGARIVNQGSGCLGLDGDSFIAFFISVYAPISFFLSMYISSFISLRRSTSSVTCRLFRHIGSGAHQRKSYRLWPGRRRTLAPGHRSWAFFFLRSFSSVGRLCHSGVAEPMTSWDESKGSKSPVLRLLGLSPLGPSCA